MKTEILQTSLEQFLKHGIRKMSVQKLIEPLGISTKTVYKHFENKEDLVRQVLSFYYKENYRVLESRATKQNVVALLCDIWYVTIEAELKVNQTFFRDLVHYYPELNERFVATTDKVFTELFLRILQRGIDEGVLKGDIIPEVALNGMFVLYMAIVRKGYFKKFRLTPPELLFNTVLVYIRGMCTQNGIEELDKHVQTFRSFEKPWDLKEKAAANL